MKINGVVQIHMTQGTSSIVQLTVPQEYVPYIGEIYFTCSALNICRKFELTNGNVYRVEIEPDDTKNVQIAYAVYMTTFDLTFYFIDGNIESETGARLFITKKQNPVTCKEV